MRYKITTFENIEMELEASNLKELFELFETKKESKKKKDIVVGADDYIISILTESHIRLDVEGNCKKCKQTIFNYDKYVIEKKHKICHKCSKVQNETN